MFTLLFLSVKSAILILVCLFLRKSSIYLMRVSGIFLFLRLCASLAYKTRLNAPTTSKLKIKAILGLFLT
jgi:hypothetical protein